MWRVIRAVLGLAAITAAGALRSPSALAQAAAPPVRAWSDASDLPTVTAAGQLLETEYRARYELPAPMSAAALAAARAAQLQNIDKVIAGLERRLASLKPDDPQRAGVLTQLETFRKARAQVAAQPAPRPAAPRPPRPKGPVTLAQALASTRALVETGTGRQAFAKLLASPVGKDPRQAEALAAGAVLQDRPVGALAALLAARAAEPRNPAHLVNAAGLLSLLGRPAEALALLDAADALKVSFPAAMGLNGQAVALNNRGHALLALDRAKEAETVLRRAVALEPLLAEARTNLAMALRAQDRKDEAVRFFRSGLRRSPPPAAAPPPASGQTPPPAPTPPTDPFSPEAGARRPASEVFDLSRGVGGKLPTILYPKSPAEGQALQPKLERMFAELMARQAPRQQKLQSLGAGRRPAQGPAEALGRARVAEIIRRLGHLEVAREPSLRRLWADVVDARERNFGEVVFNGSGRFLPGTATNVDGPKDNPATAPGRFAIELRRLSGEENKELGECRGAKASDCVTAVKAKYDGPFCDAARKGIEDWRTAMLRLDGAVAAYFGPAYKLMTGLAANISDPVDHQVALLAIEESADTILRLYLLEPARSAGFSPMYSMNYRCKQPGEGPDPKPAELKPAVRCFLGASGASFRADLLIVEIAIDCEKVALEYTQTFLILDGFVEVEYGLEGTGKGNVTVGVGVKGGVGGGPLGAGVEAKGGCFVTVDTGTGNFVDVGVRGGVSAGAGAVEVEAGGSISFIAG